ncbi:FAD-dependent monooxygenase [Sphingosinicella sp. YJ22]|uniref:NAD(P)/FAD-dependent oxidoreductase n=1 Tax=Sphingosinicella sp. YJ22 TaxID=1104780 RepID=UPI001A9C28B4|nr:FAD-dependent monooxygenase [Sphingosinicella sp. YJ22]
MSDGRRIVEALVVGGGPAGSATAMTLARGGAQVELIERQAGPHDVVCGGFLGWDALAALRRLGVDADGLGARPIARLRLASARRLVETRLPKPAAGLSRRRLDEALRNAAEESGAVVRRGLAARGGDPASLIVRMEDGSEIQAGALFLATGKHELRGLARPLDQRRRGAVGLRAAFAPGPKVAAALDGVIELHPFDGGYAGLLLQEDGQANLCMSVSSEKLRRSGGVRELLEALARETALLAERLEAAYDAAWISVGNVPYGWRASGCVPKLYRVGDQAAVIASLAGDGIAMALTSGMAAADAYRRGETGDRFQRGWSARAARPLRVAEGLRWAAETRLPRRLAMGAMGVAPGLAGLAARLTRIA